MAACRYSSPKTIPVQLYSSPVVMRQHWLDGLEGCSREPTAGDDDVTASTLRFLCGAMVLLVRFFGVLVVAVVAPEVMFRVSEAEESSLVSPALQWPGRHFKSVTSIHLQNLKMKRRVREDAILFWHKWVEVSCGNFGNSGR
jgi:hypothetical protein